MARCVSPVYVRLEKGGVFAPCGRCIECLKTKSGDWSFRLKQELKTAKNAFFITLTYDDQNLPENGELVKKDLQLFMKRLRKLNANPLRYYAIGEYGGETFRPHYHIILYNMNDSTSVKKAWGKGFVKIGTVTSGSINYVCSYIIFKNEGNYTQKPFALMSKNLGLNYLRANWKWHKSELKSYVMENGYKKHMPRYYQDKVFNYREKEAIKEKTVNLLANKEIEEMKHFSTSRQYFADKLENRQQQVNKIIKKSKKINL